MTEPNVTTVHTEEELREELAKRLLPKLVHAGTYALYETPDGGRHLSYRRTVSVDADGVVRDVDGEDDHLPDFPPEALPLISAWLEHGFPPAVLAMLGGKASPLRMLGALKEAMANGG